MKRPAWTNKTWWSRMLPVSIIQQCLKFAKNYSFSFARTFDFAFTIAYWRTWYHHPDLENPGEDPAHDEASRWVLAYNPGRPDDEDVYNSVLKYAERQYDQSVKINEALDKKLDDLWRNASTIGTILAAAAKFLPMSVPVASSPLIVAALVALALTVILSAYTRGPASMAVPTATQSILEVIESDPPPKKGQVEGIEAASYHFATIGMTRVNLWKSTQIKRATVLFCLGLLLLVAALLLAGPSSSNSSSPSSIDPSNNARHPAARPVL